MWAGAQVSQDLIEARQGIKEALKEAELQKTIKVMEAQIKLEEKKTKKKNSKEHSKPCRLKSNWRSKINEYKRNRGFSQNTKISYYK